MLVQNELKRHHCNSPYYLDVICIGLLLMFICCKSKKKKKAKREHQIKKKKINRLTAALFTTKRQTTKGRPSSITDLRSTRLSASFIQILRRRVQNETEPAYSVHSNFKYVTRKQSAANKHTCGW